MERKERLENAVKEVLPVVSTLNKFEWNMLSSIIAMHYNEKAAKTMLDGDSIEQLEKNLYSEFIR